MSFIVYSLEFFVKMFSVTYSAYVREANDTQVNK